MKDSAFIALDEDIIKARDGDLRSFAALVRAHDRTVYSLALRMLNNRQAAEDTAQEVFMQLHDKLSSIQSGSHLAFWLRRVTAHRAIDQIRRNSHIETTSLDELGPLSESEKHGDPLLQRQLRRLMLELAAPARAVMLLRYQEDLDPVEIARTLDMSVNTVKSHLKRSVEALRRGLLIPPESHCESTSA